MVRSAYLPRMEIQVYLSYFNKTPHSNLNPVFESLAADLTRPGREDLLQETIWHDRSYAENFRIVFGHLEK